MMIGSHVDNHHWCDYVSLVTSPKYAWIIRITLSQNGAATEQWQISRKEEINLRNASYDIVDSGAGLRPCVQPFGSESRAQLVSARWRGFLVGQSESRLRGAARRDFASCVSYLRFNPRHGTVPPPRPTASRGNACPYALTPSSPSPPFPLVLSLSLPFSVTLTLLSGNCTRVAMGIQFSLSRSSRIEHFVERNRANVPITSV